MPEHADTPNYHPLVRQVARALRGRCGVKAGATVVVGCSGGADSVALVRSLALLAERRRWRLNLIVGHVHHHLRGDDADQDATFVEGLAGSLGLAYERRDIHPGDEPGNVEANARRQRYQALADIALQHGACFVATAHHADDQLETLLMRILRGASVEGLRGIAWRRRLRCADASAKVYAIRPMLGVPKENVQGFLETLEQLWHDDPTNSDTDRTRAKLRHDVIPLLKTLQHDAAGKANALTDHFGQVHDIVQQHVQDTLGETTLDTLDRGQARTLNPLVLTQLLRRELIDAGVGADRLSNDALRPVVEAVRDRVGGTRTFRFANDVTITLDRDAVRIIRP